MSLSVVRECHLTEAVPSQPIDAGEMAEWLKAHAWKACLGETLTWVRIPFVFADYGDWRSREKF